MAGFTGFLKTQSKLVNLENNQNDESNVSQKKEKTPSKKTREAMLEKEVKDRDKIIVRLKQERKNSDKYKLTVLGPSIEMLQTTLIDMIKLDYALAINRNEIPRQLVTIDNEDDFHQILDKLNELIKYVLQVRRRVNPKNLGYQNIITKSIETVEDSQAIIDDMREKIESHTRYEIQKLTIEKDTALDDLKQLKGMYGDKVVGYEIALDMQRKLYDEIIESVKKESEEKIKDLTRLLELEKQENANSSITNENKVNHKNTNIDTNINNFSVKPIEVVEKIATDINVDNNIECFNDIDIDLSDFEELERTIQEKISNNKKTVQKERNVNNIAKENPIKKDESTEVLNINFANAIPSAYEEFKRMIKRDVTTEIEERQLDNSMMLLKIPYQGESSHNIQKDNIFFIKSGVNMDIFNKFVRNLLGKNKLGTMPIAEELQSIHIVFEDITTKCSFHNPFTRFIEDLIASGTPYWTLTNNLNISISTFPDISRKGICSWINYKLGIKNAEPNKCSNVYIAKDYVSLKAII